ncbi:MAG: DNA/RNA nuclease SfsA [Holophaga sp.]|nr:DNA/RNA nuclease SfsA [Holophaga sp.]
MAVITLRGLVLGRILSRYKRFLADVELESGSVVTVHTTNTGTMKTCWEPGDRVLLEPASNPERKLPFTWIACEREGHWVGVDTGIPNKVVAEAARRDVLPGLSGLNEVRTEIKYGAERSRIDVLAKDEGGRSVYIEVKNATLRCGNHVCFPDAVSERGTKHLRELQAMVREGHRAAIVFFVHREDVSAFDVAREIDSAYAAELDRAEALGVLILPVQVGLLVQEQSQGWALTWTLNGLLPWVVR